MVMVLPKVILGGDRDVLVVGVKEYDGGGQGAARREHLRIQARH